MKIHNIYPVYESEAESWERFSKIYELTDQSIGQDDVVPVNTDSIVRSWEEIAKYWAGPCFVMTGIDFMYEAIYHVRYRTFSLDVTTSNELLLVLLIEDELCRCGYAFRTWCNMKEFENVYRELMFPKKRNRGWSAFCPPCLELYLAGNMANRIMLKDRRPIDWGNEIDCDRATFPYGPDYMRYRIMEYERAISILIPEADQWYEKWMDGTYAAECIKARYGMDFTNDQNGFNHLIELVIEKDNPRCCAPYLYRLQNVTPNLLAALWGDKTTEMLQRCFVNIYHRRKRSRENNTTRSNYDQQKVMQSWLYWWAYQNRDECDTKLGKKVKRAVFSVMMNA